MISAPGRLTTLAAVLALITVTSDVAAQTGNDARPYGRVRVVAIGVSKTVARGYAELPSVDVDLNGITELFGNRFHYEIASSLRGPAATKAAATAAIDRVLRDSGDDDIVIIYWAGHGEAISAPPDRGIPGRTTGFLIPADATLDAGRRDNFSEWSAKAVDMRWLSNRAQQTRARHVVLLVDACHAGFVGTRSGFDQLSASERQLLNGRSRFALTAVRESEQAVSDDVNGGRFTFWLRSALSQGEALTLWELYERVRKNVKEHTRASGDAYTMTPQLHDFADRAQAMNGEFVFVPLGRSSAEETVLARAEAIRALLRIRGEASSVTAAHLFQTLIAHPPRFSASAPALERDWKSRVDRFLTEAPYNPRAAAALSHAYAKGLGVTADPGAAYRWALEAWNQGEPAGSYALALAYRDGRGVVKNALAAERLTQEAYEGGDIPAITDVVIRRLQRLGSNVSDADLRQARDEASRASESGYAQATLLLARLYALKAPALPSDRTRAAELFRAAANSGSTDAMVVLANRGYADFRLEDIPPDEALRWLETAADVGDAVAQRTLGQAACSICGTPFEAVTLGKDTGRALALLELAAAQDDAWALWQLSEFAQRGFAMTPDLQKARDYLDRAAAQNLGAAVARQAAWKIDGIGYPKNPREGFLLALRADELGSAQGTYIVSLCLLNGIGLPPGRPAYPTEGQHWLIRAAARGFESAVTVLREYPFTEGMLDNLRENVPDDLRLLEALRPGVTTRPPGFSFEPRN